MLSRGTKTKRNVEKKGRADLASPRRSGESTRESDVVDETFADDSIAYGAVTEDLTRIFERYAAIMNATAEMNAMNKALAEIGAIPKLQALQNVVDANSSQHFKELTRFADILTELYDNSIDINLHIPASGLRGAIEDRKNIESYFSNSVRKVTDIGKK
ncbi:hypothetical protein LY56_00415 [Roseinatronobacter thiooxidans]|uniref:Uncharacterized protein n=1 Tax=Roseinatronobacter thiooxidans TaxID=121821 RepID=A0A2W7QG22_9RHOB|nr:hypothetical protein [Roseinatronobacter thiooxidans]PZX47121.1 hypothetical protein LY56_00415 [Roseinatronobacter thiooxidans]